MCLSDSYAFGYNVNVSTCHRSEVSPQAHSLPSPFSNDVMITWCFCLCLHVRLDVCVGEKGAGTQCRALTSTSTPTADSSPFITPAQPHTLASFLPCLLVFLSISLAALGVGGAKRRNSLCKRCITDSLSVREVR